MSIPKKGIRKIVVAEESFIWLIRRKATNWQAYYPEGCLCVVIKHAHQPGSLLVIATDRLHPKGFSLESELTPVPCKDESQEIRVWKIEPSKINPVKPSDVACWIQQALDMGWLPKKSGVPFEIVGR